LSNESADNRFEGAAPNPMIEDSTKGRLLGSTVERALRAVVRTTGVNTVKIGSAAKCRNQDLQTDVGVPLRFDAGYTAAMSLDSLNPS
jgi:hypothetical protein